MTNRGLRIGLLLSAMLALTWAGARGVFAENEEDVKRRLFELILPPTGGDRAVAEIAALVSAQRELLAAKDQKERTPLEVAAEHGQYLTVQSLRELSLDARNLPEQLVRARARALRAAPYDRLEATLHALAPVATGANDRTDLTGPEERDLLRRLRDGSTGLKFRIPVTGKAPPWLRPVVQGDVTTLTSSEGRLVDGSNALHVAVVCAPRDVVERLIHDNGGALCRQPNLRGSTPLHAAAWANNAEAVKKIVENLGQEALKEEDRFGITPLHYLYWHGNLDLLAPETDSPDRLGTPSLTAKLKDELAAYVKLARMTPPRAVFSPVVEGMGHRAAVLSLPDEIALKLLSSLSRGGADVQPAWTVEGRSMREALVVEDAITKYGKGDVPSEKWFEKGLETVEVEDATAARAYADVTGKRFFWQHPRGGLWQPLFPAVVPSAWVTLTLSYSRQNSKSERYHHRHSVYQWLATSPPGPRPDFKSHLKLGDCRLVWRYDPGVAGNNTTGWGQSASGSRTTYLLLKADGKFKLVVSVDGSDGNTNEDVFVEEFGMADVVQKHVRTSSDRPCGTDGSRQCRLILQVE